MRILTEKDLIIRGEIREVKDLMLYRVMLFSGIVGIPIVFCNILFSYGLDVSFARFVNLFLFIPIISIVLMYRRIKYLLKAYTLIYAVILMSLYNFYIAGYTGVAYMFALSSVAFSVAFLNEKQAIINIFACIFVCIICAFLYVKGIWTFHLQVSEALVKPHSWSMTIVIFAFLSFMFIVAYNVIQQKLIQKIETEHKTNISLEETNKKLKELVDKQEEYQRELLLAKQNAEDSNNLKNEFLHNMSHEVRTPLNAIIGFSKLYMKEDISEEKRDQYAKIVIKNSESLQTVIDNILEISFLETRQISTNIEKINVQDLLSDLLVIFKVSNGFKGELRMNCPKERIYIESDSHKLNKILSNLLENALKFTENGYVEFGCYELKDNTVCFFVKDTGIGIEEKNFEKIFSRFSQGHDKISEKYGGLGLGLCIAKENTDLLGGKISVESEIGVGTIFYVNIPVHYNNK